MSAYEMNFDGLVGPTHNYGGLSYGNVASQSNSQAASSPKEAALQGLGKMKALMDMGFKQGVFAPQERQDVAALRSLGFTGTAAGDDSDGGTPLYVAPECLAGQQPTVRSDIYSLGILLFQLLLGDLRRPLTPGWDADIDDELLRGFMSAAMAEGSVWGE